MKRKITKKAVDHAKEILKLYAEQNDGPTSEYAHQSESKVKDKT